MARISITNAQLLGFSFSTCTIRARAPVYHKQASPYGYCEGYVLSTTQSFWQQFNFSSQTQISKPTVAKPVKLEKPKRLFVALQSGKMITLNLKLIWVLTIAISTTAERNYIMVTITKWEVF
jgi:hypothetical protein